MKNRFFDPQFRFSGLRSGPREGCPAILAFTAFAFDAKSPLTGSVRRQFQILERGRRPLPFLVYVCRSNRHAFIWHFKSESSLFFIPSKILRLSRLFLYLAFLNFARLAPPSKIKRRACYRVKYLFWGKLSVHTFVRTNIRCLKLSRVFVLDKTLGHKLARRKITFAPFKASSRAHIWLCLLQNNSRLGV